jgi:hypothetical protein
MKTVDSSSLECADSGAALSGGGWRHHAPATRTLDAGPLPEDGFNVPCCTVAASGDLRVGVGAHHLSQN